MTLVQRALHAIEGVNILSRSRFWVAAGSFLLVSYVPYRHWDEFYFIYTANELTTTDLLAIEKGLAQGFFPEGFFSAKIGFMVLLRFLTQVMGDGLFSLYLIQFVFAFMVIVFAGVSYGLLREILEEQDASNTAIVVLFLPVTVYLGYKILSEAPSMLLITFGSWQFLKSFRSTGRNYVNKHLALGTITLFAGIISRFTGVLAFAGLIVGLLVMRDPRYPWKTVIWRSTQVGGGLLVLAIPFFWLLGQPIEQFTGPLRTVIETDRGVAVKLYALVMFVQFFAPVMICSIKPPWKAKLRFSLGWASVGILPVLLSAQHIEPRFFITALIPLAILICTGLDNLIELLPDAKSRMAGMLILAIIVMSNRIIFAPITPYEINQQEYARMMAKLSWLYPQATYTVPWVTDYSFLRFAYPEKNIKLVNTKTKSAEPEFYQSQPFLQWTGEGNYAGSFDDLAVLPEPWVYIGWDYNPAIMRMEAMLDRFGIDYLVGLEQLDHLAVSWIWSHPGLELQKIVQVGPYSAFKIRASSSYMVD